LDCPPYFGENSSHRILEKIVPLDVGEKSSHQNAGLPTGAQYLNAAITREYLVPIASCLFTTSGMTFNDTIPGCDVIDVKWRSLSYERGFFAVCTNAAVPSSSA
jgi:hypothetical protein